MRPTDYVPQVRERIDAAWGYIENFKLESVRFFDTKPCGIVAEQEPKGANKVFRYRFVVRRGIPVELRRPVTACIGELRPILDNIVFGLSQIAGEPPSCEIDFPINLRESHPKPKGYCFDKWVRDNQTILSKFPAGAVDLIRQVQPFNPDKRGNTGARNIIYVLNKLANQDKHKMPLQIAGVHNYRVSVPRFTLTGPFRIAPGRTLEHNSVLMEVTMPASDPTNGFEIKIATHITFDKDGPALGAPVYEFLVYAHNFIRDEVVAKFEPFFPT